MLRVRRPDRLRNVDVLEIYILVILVINVSNKIVMVWSGVSVDFPLGRVQVVYCSLIACLEHIKTTCLCLLRRWVNLSRCLVVSPHFRDMLYWHILDSVTLTTVARKLNKKNYPDYIKLY